MTENAKSLDVEIKNVGPDGFKNDLHSVVTSKSGLVDLKNRQVLSDKMISIEKGVERLGPATCSLEASMLNQT